MFFCTPRPTPRCERLSWRRYCSQGSLAHAWSQWVTPWESLQRSSGCAETDCLSVILSDVAQTIGFVQMLADCQPKCSLVFLPQDPLHWITRSYSLPCWTFFSGLLPAVLFVPVVFTLSSARLLASFFVSPCLTFFCTMARLITACSFVLTACSAALTTQVRLYPWRKVFNGVTFQTARTSATASGPQERGNPDTSAQFSQKLAVIVGLHKLDDFFEVCCERSHDQSHASCYHTIRAIRQQCSFPQCSIQREIQRQRYRSEECVSSSAV